MFTTAPRLQLDEKFKDICPNVYFQPPEDISMDYPCIVYRYEPNFVAYADNVPYRSIQRYEVTLITQDPDDILFEQLKGFPQSRHSASFVAENLNHYAFAIYY